MASDGAGAGPGAAAAEPSPKHTPDEPVLQKDLESLRRPRRKRAAGLYRLQSRIGDPAVGEPRSQNIGGGNRVLDREIDADAADRRHCMSGVADAEEARPVPYPQADRNPGTREEQCQHHSRRTDDDSLHHNFALLHHLEAPDRPLDPMERHFSRPRDRGESGAGDQGGRWEDLSRSERTASFAAT